MSRTPTCLVLPRWPLVPQDPPLVSPGYRSTVLRCVEQADTVGQLLLRHFDAPTQTSTQQQGAARG